MEKAIKMNNEEYKTMQENLKITANNIYQKSLENLKELIKNNEVIKN